MDCRIVIAVVSAVIAILRVVGVTNTAYQAVAHMLVGGLAGAWLVGRQRFYAVVFWALFVVETLCVLRDRFF